MSHFIDGFVLPLPKDKIDKYREIAEKACKVWLEHGALEYRECVGEDLNIEGVLPFPKIASAGEADTVVFAYIVYNSKEHRDEVNAKVMADPRMSEMCSPDDMPFDCSKMAMGGFKTVVYGKA